MKFSLIITARSESEALPALESIRTLVIPEGVHFETILALGESPSRQRNEAALKASGDYLLFLDSDAALSPRLLHYYKDALSYESDEPDKSEIKIVGGPSTHPTPKHLLEKSIQVLFTSEFGLGPFRARYFPYGEVRPSSERELILCNLFVKRDLFLEHKGFNEKLYPNEENEFLNRLQKVTTPWYHPLAVVTRHQRQTLGSFLVQMISYGRGRVLHYRLMKRNTDLIFLLPFIFFLYLSFLLVSPFVFEDALNLLMLGPLFLYLLMNIPSALLGGIRVNDPRVIPLVSFLFILCHYFYGLGLLIGILGPMKKLSNKPVEVKII